MMNYQKTLDKKQCRREEKKYQTLSREKEMVATNHNKILEAIKEAIQIIWVFLPTICLKDKVHTLTQAVWEVQEAQEAKEVKWADNQAWDNPHHKECHQAVKVKCSQVQEAQDQQWVTYLEIHYREDKSHQEDDMIKLLHMINFSNITIHLYLILQVK